MCKCSPYLKETKSQEWDTSTLKLRRKRTNILTILLPYFFPNSPNFWLRILKSNAFQHYLSKPASSPSSHHSIFSHYAGRTVCETWSTSHSKAHGLCTRLAMLATARHQGAKHVAVFGNLVLLAQIDAILSFETRHLQNWKCQYTSRE